MPWLWAGLGEAYACAGRFDEAARTLKDSIELSHKLGMNYWEAWAHRTFGESLLQQEGTHTLAPAEDHFAQALSLFKRCKSEPDIARTYASWGNLQRRQGKMAEAHATIDQALLICDALGMAEESQRAHQLRAQLSRTTA